MFWKKKPVVAAPATAGTTAVPAGMTSSAAKAEVSALAKDAKLSGVGEIPELAGRHLVTAKKQDPDWVWHLKAVTRTNPGKGKKAFDVRVFDEAKASAKKVKIKDWTTLDQYPDLILFEGWFDKESLTAELEKKAG